MRGIEVVVLQVFEGMRASGLMNKREESVRICIVRWWGMGTRGLSLLVGLAYLFIFFGIGCARVWGLGGWLACQIKAWRGENGKCSCSAARLSDFCCCVCSSCLKSVRWGGSLFLYKN